MKVFTSRFAPTPSGYLHLGNCITFAITWLMARVNEGEINLRIDDIDAERTRPEYIEDIFATLEWLGLDYDFGPSGVEDFKKNFSQHLRIEIYNKYLNKLIEKNEVYACKCSRQDIRNVSPDRKYPQTCRNLNIPLDTPDTALRIKLPSAGKKVSFRDFMGVQNLEIKTTTDDFVVRQKNGLPAYHLASVVDDCLSQINVIVRGEDLFSSTAAQIYLAERIELNSFKDNLFIHLPLLKNTAGEKISKSTDTLGVWKLQKTESERQFIFQNAAQWLKISPRQFNAQEVLKSYRENFGRN